MVVKSGRPRELHRLLLHGLVIVSLFAVMHEAVHYSAFRSRRLNELAAWLAGFGILFNATYYRQFHFAHHRYAQDPARDPELLTAPPPRSRAAYWWRVIAIPYWRAIATWHETVELGRTGGAIDETIRDTLAGHGFGPALNPGHLTHLDECKYGSKQHPDNQRHAPVAPNFPSME